MRDMRPPLAWPRSLEFPSQRVTVVYLDLNHWIFLAQASVGHSQGRPFAKALEACRAAVSAGSAVFVLSQTHYIEMLKIKDWNQRKAVADIMEQLTHFSTLLNRSILMKLEFSTAVERFTKEQKHLPVMSLVGRGVFHCYGKPGGFK